MASKMGAYQAVQKAIKRGDLPRATECSCDNCGNPASSYHHYKGHSRRHYLTVVPLCNACHGAVHGKDKPRRLEDDQVKQARQMRASGMKVKDIAAHFKMHRDSVSRAILGKSYKWVD